MNAARNPVAMLSSLPPMEMDDNEEFDDANGEYDGQFDDDDDEFDDDDATPCPHKDANARKTQIDEGPFRTPLILDSKNCAVERAEDTESDRSDLENLGNAHKECERQGVSYTRCLFVMVSDNPSSSPFLGKHLFIFLMQLLSC